ncbi:MAG TPA: hydrogenase iron-sulfur subunit [Syntrophorhabdaceae bacterium]|jgi:F420-non-reducing hydrogenase iron-sulfur subunit|nr:hydrogenase iron-sulfur subunit [Syntrophorhabdaceae bacterium]MBP8699519.1 hydrogenase iron-sulfur subunit [Syntrophorhabdaceae bacterium]HOB69670.1 hydrogenase iron-sulfur subunit [Syntrophorhabdaceae bacterium]HOF58393.1 hydrogenase iron-sulfur subunit [Syntrophorhabdaceae bacterium]HOS06254.1 hydrogenase iron-sulfur subunit [Syntrophorhabdaceae bacterium]
MSTDKVEKNPEIIGFACLYCTFKASEMAGSLRLKYPEGIRLIQVPCSSRVDPAFVLKAIFEGADGVFVAGCHPGDCHFIKGNYFTRRKIAALKEMLDAFNMKEKIRLFWVSAAEARRFVDKVTTMYNEIKERKNVREKG